MAYSCPKCGGAVTRTQSGTAQALGGVVGLLIYSAFAGLSCAKCGTIEKKEFSAGDRATMLRNSVLMAIGGVVLLVVVLAILAAINH